MINGWKINQDNAKYMSRLRTIVERLARGRTLKRTITVSGKPTPFFVSPDAQLKYLKLGSKTFDRDLILIAERFLTETSIVWDIGANVGAFTFSSASVASRGTVVSVEADIWLATILRKSTRLEAYRDSDIRIVPVAVSDSDSIATFLIASRGRASNALEAVGGRSQAGGSREKQYVPTLRLDTLLHSMPEPDFVKIDVEGAELLVLNSASKITGQIRPVFYIEVGQDTSADILDLFHRKDYLAVDPDGKVLNKRCARNTLFIPVENKKAQQDAGVNVANAP